MTRPAAMAPRPAPSRRWAGSRSRAPWPMTRAAAPTPLASSVTVAVVTFQSPRHKARRMRTGRPGPVRRGRGDRRFAGPRAGALRGADRVRQGGVRWAGPLRVAALRATGLRAGSAVRLAAVLPLWGAGVLLDGLPPPERGATEPRVAMIRPYPCCTSGHFSHTATR